MRAESAVTNSSEPRWFRNLHSLLPDLHAGTIVGRKGVTRTEFREERNKREKFAGVKSHSSPENTKFFFYFIYFFFNDFFWKSVSASGVGSCPLCLRGYARGRQWYGAAADHTRIGTVVGRYV